MKLIGVGPNPVWLMFLNIATQTQKKNHGISGLLWAKERGLKRNQPCQHLLAIVSVKKLISCCLSHSVCGTVTAP